MILIEIENRIFVFKDNTDVQYGKHIARFFLFRATQDLYIYTKE